MRIVQADDIDTLAPTPQLQRLIDQHPDPQTFERWDLLGHIMIAKNTDDTQVVLDALEKALHWGIDVMARAANLEPVVACHHTEIHLKILQACTNSVGKAREPIGMKVGEMENLQSAEALR